MSEVWVTVKFKPSTESSELRKIYRELDLFLIEDYAKKHNFDMRADFKARIQRADANAKARQLRQWDCVASVTVDTRPPVL